MIEKTNQVVSNTNQNFAASSFSKPSASVLAHIFSYSLPIDICSMINSCSKLRVRIFNNEKIWQNFAVQQKIPRMIDSISCRELFLQVMRLEQPWKRNKFKKTEIKAGNTQTICQLDSKGMYHSCRLIEIESFDVNNKKVIVRVDLENDSLRGKLKYFNGDKGIASRFLGGDEKDIELAVFDKNTKITNKIIIKNCLSEPDSLMIIKDTIFFQIEYDNRKRKVFYFYEIPTVKDVTIDLSEIKAIEGFRYTIQESGTYIYQEKHIQIYSFEKLNREGNRCFQIDLPTKIYNQEFSTYTNYLLIQNVLVTINGKRITGYDFKNPGSESPELWSVTCKKEIYKAVQAVDGSPLFAITTNFDKYDIYNVLTGKQIGLVAMQEPGEIVTVSCVHYLTRNSFSHHKNAYGLFIVKEFEEFAYPVIPILEEEPLPLPDNKIVEEENPIKTEQEEVLVLVDGLEKNVVKAPSKETEVSLVVIQSLEDPPQALEQPADIIEQSTDTLEESANVLEQPKINNKISKIKKSKVGLIYDLAKITAIYALIIFSCFVMHRFVYAKLQSISVQGFINRFWKRNKSL